MRKTVLTALFLAYAVFSLPADTESYSSGEYGLEIIIPDKAADFGSTVLFSLKINYPETDSYILLPPAVGADSRYANTVITAVEEKLPILDGRGSAAVEIVFETEAWLPGELIFPPMTVRFGQSGKEISTEEIIIDVKSAFEVENESRTPAAGGNSAAPSALAPLYIPETEKSGIIRALPVAGAVIVTGGIAAAVLLAARRKKKQRAAAPPQKTRLQLLVEFRRRFIDVTGAVDLREAYTALQPLLPPEDAARFAGLFETARFSKEGLNYAEGYRQLVQIFGTLSADMASVSAPDAAVPEESRKGAADEL